MRKKLAATILLNLSVLAVLFVAFGSVLQSPFEITRLRNSLIAQEGESSEFEWVPESMPEDFRQETVDAPIEFRDVIESFINVAEGYENLDRGLAIARHLASGPGPGPGIMSNTLQTYGTIMTEKKGYCSDYTQVFNGLGIAANVPVREWGMSFDGYSGDGHAFNEIYDEFLGKWVFIDSFYSFIVTDADSGVPLSVLEFRERLLNGRTNGEIRVVPIVADRYAFKDAEATLEYYRGGANQMFLWFGNDVFSYDRYPFISFLGRYSRALEQSVAILLGVHPRMKLIVGDDNRDDVRHLRLLRYLVVGGLTLTMALFVLLLYQLSLLYRSRMAR